VASRSCLPFAVTVPSSAQSVTETAREAAMRRILVVDDDPQVRLVIAAWLKGCGFRVAVADGSANSLAALDDTSVDS
jgi:PleD family two-component response regulator